MSVNTGSSILTSAGCSSTDFSAAIYPVIYGFDAKIPVAIWDGDCVIDFQEVYDYIHFLYEKDPNPPQ